VYPEGLPQRRWLEHYATLFDTVEINNTFYRLPTEKAVAGWVAETPEEFTFTVKVSRYITHVKRLKEPKKYTERFFKSIRPLVKSKKLGPVLWQLPPNFKRDDERLAGALEAAPEGRHAFEFRHESWFSDDVYDLLRSHGAALVLADDPERPRPPHVRTADWTFVRLHRGGQGRRGRYSPEEIKTWARRIAQWRRETEVYAYFNNDWEAFAPANAQRLKDALGA
jgi:uncharacterized protein YecE (DUF72 family)